MKIQNQNPKQARNESTNKNWKSKTRILNMQEMNWRRTVKIQNKTCKKIKQEGSKIHNQTRKNYRRRIEKEGLNRGRRKEQTSTLERQTAIQWRYEGASLRTIYGKTKIGGGEAFGLERNLFFLSVVMRMRGVDQKKVLKFSLKRIMWLHCGSTIFFRDN